MEKAAAAAKYALAAARGEEAALALPLLGAIETLFIRWLQPAFAPGDMAALSALTGLRELDLWDTVLPDPSCLTALPQLEVLRFSHAGVDPRLGDTLGELQCLTRLHLHGVWLEGGGDGRLDAVPLVARAASLRALSVSPEYFRDKEMVRVTDESAAVLARCLPRLDFLGVACSQMSSAGACGLAGLVSLEHLALRDNGIHDAGAVALTSLTALTKLDLYFTNIGTPGVKALACLTNLVSLDVGGNLRIDDEGAKALASMTHLTALCVSGRDFGKCAKAALRATFGAEHAYSAFDTGMHMRWGGAEAPRPYGC
jgi:hypothetical protein